MEYLIGLVIGAIIQGIIFGCIGRAIVSSKGYDSSENHGFAWGFWLSLLGIIVCACKTNLHYVNKPN